MTRMTMKQYRFLLLLLILVGCHRERDEPTPSTLPACVQQLIQQNGKRSSGEEFIELYHYTYQKRSVYFGFSACCDRYNVLFDQTCQTLCAPSGGFTGGGDGMCPNFFNEATEETLLWRRPQ